MKRSVLAPRCPQFPLTSTCYHFQVSLPFPSPSCSSLQPSYSQYSGRCCSHCVLSVLYLNYSSFSRRNPDWSAGHIQSTSFSLCSRLFQKPLSVLSPIYNKDPSLNHTMEQLCLKFLYYSLHACIHHVPKPSYTSKSPVTMARQVPYPQMSGKVKTTFKPAV